MPQMSFGGQDSDEQAVASITQGSYVVHVALCLLVSMYSNDRVSTIASDSS